MFALDPVHPLFDAIVRAVAKEPSISVSDLHKRLKSQKIDVTLQHLYRKINQLIEEQILLKDKGTLTVNLMWLSFLEFFAGSAKESLAEAAGETVFPLKEGARLSFSADNLLDVQTLWNHFLIRLHRISPQKYLYKYYSHAWWIWSKRPLDSGFYRSIKQKGIRCLWLYGNDSFLDREAALLHQTLFDSRIATDSPFPKEGYNLNVYGEYIFECNFPDNVSRHLALLFRSIPSTSKEDRALLSDIFSLKGDFKVTIWRNAKQSARHQAAIGRYFLVGAKMVN